MMAKILKYSIITLLVLLVTLLIAPFFLKDEIMAEIKKYVNESVNAEVQFKDVDISMIKSFPDISVTINDLNISGIDTFTNVDLIKAKKLKLDFSLLPFFDKSKPLSLKYIGAENGLINILILNDSMANYLITKPSNDTSKFKLTLDNYELKDIDINYVDYTIPLKFTGKNVAHNGKGDISKDIFDLNTTTHLDSLTLNFDGFTYLKNIPADLKANINIDWPKLLFTLKDNDITLGKLKAIGDGSVKLLPDESMELKVSFDSKSQNFSNFLSVLPYLSAYNTAKANGNIKLSGNVEGKMNSAKKIYPSFNINIDIDKGSAQYAGLPESIKNVYGSIKIKSTKSNLKDLNVSIKNFNAEVGNEKIKGNFNIDDGLTDPHIVGNLFADINLANWSKAIPIDNLEKLEGRINANLAFDAKQSDIDKSNYNSIKFDGNASGSNILFKSKNHEAIQISKADFVGSPAEIKISTQDVKIGKSDLDINGTLENPMAYFSKNKNLKGKINLNSNLIDLNEWIEKSNNNQTSTTISPDVNSFKYSEVDVKAKIGKLIYGNHEVSNIDTDGKFGLENLDIKNLSATLDDSDIKFSGKLANVYSYLFNNETLVGELNLYSSKLDANKYMVKSENTPKPNPDSILFKVPERVDLVINTKLDELQYTNLNLKNFSGKTIVRDRNIIMTDMVGNMLGGKISFDGLYGTKGAKPDFNFKLDLSKLDFSKSYQSFVTIKELAPLANYINGLFNTTLVMEGNLGRGMIPELTSLTASGFIETLNGMINGYKPLQSVGEKLGLEQLKNFQLKDTRNWFEIKKGTVEIKEFTKNIQGIDLKMSGSHKIKGEMTYNMFLRIPRALLKKNVVTGTLDKGLAFLETEAAKRGVNLAQGEFIDVKVDLGGTIKNPTVKLTPLGTSGKTLEQEVKDEVNKKLEQAKDSVQKVVINKSNQIKDSIRNRAEQEIEKAKNKVNEKANEVINEAKDKIKKEVETKIDTLIRKTVSDTLKKKAGEIIKDKTGKDVDKIKEKVKDWNPFKKKKDGGG